MNHVMTRFFIVFAVSALFALAAPAMSGSTAMAARATATATATATETIVGGGIGKADLWVAPGVWSGKYSSTGQMGVGRYQIGLTAPEYDWYGVEFTRSDGMTLRGSYVYDEPNDCGTHYDPSVVCLHVELAGTADIATAHLVIHIVPRFAPSITSVKSSFLMRGTLTLRRRLGYAMVGANGTTYTFGGVAHLGDAPTSHAVDLSLTPSGGGYWVVNNAGQVYAFGDARYLGGANTAGFASGESVTSISPTPTGRGYWLFTTNGRALRFGDAALFGDIGTTRLNQRIVGSVATPTGKGYYMVAADGGVFAFGDAKFRGSMGATHLNRPVVGLVPTADNTGYWLVAADGGVFNFDAPFFGSMGAVALNRPIVAMVPYSGAYLMIASDGGVFNFSTGLFFGSAAASTLPAAIVNGAAIG
jgi:hypothetical protein